MKKAEWYLAVSGTVVCLAILLNYKIKRTVEHSDYLYTKGLIDERNRHLPVVCSTETINSQVYWDSLVTMEPKEIVFYSGYKPVLTFTREGQIIVGKGVRPDRAARLFLEYLKKYYLDFFRGRED